MSTFLSSLKLASEKVLVEVNQKCYQIAWELFTSVVRLTPSPANPGYWATGLLANQWYPKAGSPSNAKGSDVSPNGSASLSRINGMMGGMEFYGKDGKMFLNNNVPHAYRAEALGWPAPEWTGRVKPYRMVARSLQATAAKYKKVKVKV